MQLWPNEMYASSTAGLSGLLSVGVVPRWTVPATSRALRSGPSSLLASPDGCYDGCARVLPRRDDLPARSGHGRPLRCIHCRLQSSERLILQSVFA